MLFLPLLSVTQVVPLDGIVPEIRFLCHEEVKLLTIDEVTDEVVPSTIIWIGDSTVSKPIMHQEISIIASNHIIGGQSVWIWSNRILRHSHHKNFILQRFRKSDVTLSTSYDDKLGHERHWAKETPS